MSGDGKSIDPNWSGTPGPGEITDRKAYEEAKAAGLITEIPPSEGQQGVLTADAVPLVERQAVLEAKEARLRKAEDELHRLALEHAAREQRLAADERTLAAQSVELKELQGRTADKLTRIEALELQLKERELALDAAEHKLILATRAAADRLLDADQVAQEVHAATTDDGVVFLDHGRPVKGPGTRAARYSQQDAPYDTRLEREQDRHESFLGESVGTLGLPPLWARVLKAGVPALAVAARGFARSLNPESPGGRKPTRAELGDTIDRAAARFRRGLFEEFLEQGRKGGGQ